MSGTRRDPGLVMALLPIAVTMPVLVYHIFANGGAPHVPLIFGIFVSALVGLLHGFGWADIEKGIVANIAIAVPVLGIMIAVGMTISTWILCGTVPFLSKLGVTILAPQAFLPVSCIVCAIVSVATGTSWGTVGTIGLALLGIGEGLGIPIHLTAGAVVSGAWFGDKMSPLSDTTNFAAAIADVDLYRHIRNMLPTTIPSTVIALILYAVIGWEYGDGAMQTGRVASFVASIERSFSQNLIVLLPPAVILVTVARRIPALPGIFLGVVAAAVVAMLIQDASFGDVMKAAMTGYRSDTGNAELDSLLSKGGVMSMMWVVSLIMIAMAFGGVLETTGCLRVIVAAILSRLSGRAQLIAASLALAFGFNLCSNAFVAYTIPGRMFAPAYRKLNLSTANLSRVLEDGATMTAPLIPWNSGAVYVSSTLGLPTVLYAPFAFANWLAPLFDLLWAWTGFFVPAADADDIALKNAQLRQPT